jgi:hypothetical protein
VNEDYLSQSLDARCERFYDGANKVFARVFRDNPVARFVKKHQYVAVGIFASAVMYSGLMHFQNPQAAEVALQEGVTAEQRQQEKAKKSYYQRLLRQKAKHIDALIDGFLGKGD